MRAQRGPGKVGMDPAAEAAIRAGKRCSHDPGKRKKLVWEIDRKLQEDEARPIIFHNRNATCWPHEAVEG